MPNMPPNSIPLYRNAIEPLVVEEARRQIRQLPPRLLMSLNPQQLIAQVVAYALNRLPALYATSDRGWKFQQQQAEKLQPQIEKAVRQGLAAVQRDPLTPVWESPDSEAAEAKKAQLDKRRRIASYRRYQ
ncbi:late competence development ComFB family protein [Phormidium sp. CCY1219]|jgi:hypothetical protein|uniref:late competence development ComFB family protein n=1 Tax=Phormidium sp. CCY1219 TaxID=2886104 RepID=UPI002D1F2442|nr:late competence development ComFB family protein [Phormidium sp. CCY1219]MEB3829476.1 late competence development ComFB family protein [Phormidium sp. CCY1219]